MKHRLELGLPPCRFELAGQCYQQPEFTAKLPVRCDRPGNMRGTSGFTRPDRKNSDGYEKHLSMQSQTIRVKRTAKDCGSGLAEQFCRSLR